MRWFVGLRSSTLRVEAVADPGFSDKVAFIQSAGFQLLA